MAKNIAEELYYPSLEEGRDGFGNDVAGEL
jgi:hypothetical protein